MVLIVAALEPPPMAISVLVTALVRGSAPPLASSDASDPPIVEDEPPIPPTESLSFPVLLQAAAAMKRKQMDDRCMLEARIDVPSIALGGPHLKGFRAGLPRSANTMHRPPKAIRTSPVLVIRMVS